MKNPTHLEIGGVYFSIHGNILDSFQEPVLPYHPFLEKVSGHLGIRPADVTINLHIGDMPDTENLKILFNSNQSWSMYENRDGYYLSFHPPAFERPFWLAMISRDFTRTTVYCNEKVVIRKNGREVVSNPVGYPLDQILLMYILSRKQGALLHAAGINIHEKGYIFPGKSGAGKSTITGQLAVREDIGLLSDDRIVVRKIDGTFKAYGTPWPGEAGIAKNTNLPLSGIFFINHASFNRIKEITKGRALKRLLPVTSIPWYDREVMSPILSFCEDLITNIPIYELYFKPTVEIVDVIEQFVSSI